SRSGKFGDENVALGRPDGEIELLSVGAESVFGGLAGRIVKCDQYAVAAARNVRRANGPACGRARQIVKLRAIRRPRAVVCLGAVGRIGDDEPLGTARRIAHPKSVGTVVEEALAVGGPVRKVAALHGDELATRTVRQLHDGEPVPCSTEHLEQDAAAIGRPVGIELLVGGSSPLPEPGASAPARVNAGVPGPPRVETDAATVR